MNRQALSLVAAFVLGFAAILGGLLIHKKLSGPKTAPVDLPIFWPNPKKIAGFSLSDQHQQVFDDARTEQKWTFWYFGYTNCPDVCPVTLTVMSSIDQALEAQPELRARAQYVLVSVDPARDTLERLGSYVGFFSPDFIGATGSDQALDVLTRQFGVLYARQEPDENGNYLVDHTAAILLTDPQSRFVALFSAPHTAEQVVEQFRRIEAFIGG